MELTRDNKIRLRQIIDEKIQKSKKSWFVQQELKERWGLDCDDYEPDEYNR